MSHSYPGSELSVEQLVYTLAQVLNPNSPLRTELLDLEPQKICGIERELSEVSQAIRAIQNTFVPVNKLPPEILSRVLEHRACEQDLARATHVCQYWRSVLISSPSLWSCFRFEYNRGLDRTLAYLERSKSALIDVSTTVRFPEDLDVLKCLASHIARTRSLVIHESSCTYPAFFFFRDPAPSLQHLEIHAWNKDFVCLPDNFLGQQAPSLRFVNFNGVRPAFETNFPLPNLTEFRLHLPEGTGPFRMSSLFRFLSDSPLLEKLCIMITSKTTQDIPMDQVISLESLVEFEYVYNSGDRTLSHLKLPRLKQLRVFSSLGLGEVEELADILPYDGRVLLAGATKMSYRSDANSLTVKLSGNEVGISVIMPRPMEEPSIDWFCDQKCIPFGQIEDLEVNGHPTDAYFNTNVSVFENLGVLRMGRWDGKFNERFLRSLHRDPTAGVPCRSLQEIECTYLKPQEPLPRSLTSLAKKRKRAGYQLRLVSLWITQRSGQDLTEELREHVGEVRVRARDTGA